MCAFSAAFLAPFAAFFASLVLFSACFLAAFVPFFAALRQVGDAARAALIIWSSSRWAYQMSIVRICAKPAIASR